MRVKGDRSPPTLALALCALLLPWQEGIYNALSLEVRVWPCMSASHPKYPTLLTLKNGWRRSRGVQKRPNLREVPTYDGRHEIIKIGHRQHKQNTPRT